MPFFLFGIVPSPDKGLHKSLEQEVPDCKSGTAEDFKRTAEGKDYKGIPYSKLADNKK